jgi:hypothetical protein
MPIDAPSSLDDQRHDTLDQLGRLFL